MLSALILPRRGYPAVRLAAQPAHRWSVRHGPLVLVPEPRKSPTPTTDRDRTVSRRSEPSSRATLIGEQPNPWDLLQPRDVTPCGTAGSLCSSFLPVRVVALAVKLPSAIALTGRLPIGPREPLEASVTLLEATTPVKLPAKQCPRFQRVRGQTRKGPYFNGGSNRAGAPPSKPPGYPTHRAPVPNAKLQ